jgi:hypothetical protein
MLIRHLARNAASIFSSNMSDAQLSLTMDEGDIWEHVR